MLHAGQLARKLMRMSVTLQDLGQIYQVGGQLNTNCIVSRFSCACLSAEAALVRLGALWLQLVQCQCFLALDVLDAQSTCAHEQLSHVVPVRLPVGLRETHHSLSV